MTDRKFYFVVAASLSVFILLQVGHHADHQKAAQVAAFAATPEGMRAAAEAARADARSERDKKRCGMDAQRTDEFFAYCGDGSVNQRNEGFNRRYGR
jgi:hypothetical protein